MRRSRPAVDDDDEPFIVAVPRVTPRVRLRIWRRRTWRQIRYPFERWPGLCAAGCGAAETVCYECDRVHCPRCPETCPAYDPQLP